MKILYFHVQKKKSHKTFTRIHLQISVHFLSLWNAIREWGGNGFMKPYSLSCMLH